MSSSRTADRMGGAVVAVLECNNCQHRSQTPVSGDASETENTDTAKKRCPECSSTNTVSYQMSGC